MQIDRDGKGPFFLPGAALETGEQTVVSEENTVL